MTSTSITLRGLTKTFQRRSGEEVRAIDNVSLDVDAGEFLVLLGPSGCGKTTLLRSLAGLEVPTSGSIVIDDRPVFDSSRKLNVPPESRRMGMIFQSYALWPHMTVRDNVSYPLRTQGRKKAEVRQRVDQTLALVGISELAEQYPGQISGGQQQRVALARALVAGTSVVLFDEPLSNVDAKVREQLRLEIKRMHQELGFTAVYVTHDQEEAMALATRIAVLRDGHIEQLGGPADIYRRPVSLAVGRFIGQLNELEGEIEEVGSTYVVRTALGQVEAARATRNLAVGDRVVLGIRPEDVQFLDDRDGRRTENVWKGTVSLPVFLGMRNEHIVTVDGVELKVTGRGELVEESSTVCLGVEARHVHVFSAASRPDPS